MANNYSYYFTEKAEQDLDGILQYISQELSDPTAAKNLLKKIFAGIEALTACPQSGKLVQNELLPDKTIRRILVDNYVVYYKIDDYEQAINVIRISYAKRDWTNLFGNLD